MEDFILHTLFNLVCFYIAFIGLRGAYMRNLRIVPMYGGRMNYKGQRAVLWGILIFLGFIAYPLFFAYTDILGESYTPSEMVRDLLVALVAFYGAVHYRQVMGVAK
jgi:uncharacterized PurR-regulated membrane protein YhhQ (DUF165 family)